MLRGLLLIALIAPLRVFCAEPDRPPSLTNLDETKVVQLRTSWNEPCISITDGEAAVILQKAEIESLATAKPLASKAVDERRAWMNGVRAEELLSRLSSTADSYGCFTTSKSSLSDGATWLVLRQLELGAAALQLRGKNVSFVHIRYIGKVEAGNGVGKILVHLPDGTGPLLFLLWWQT